jgi:hypothetical protein
VNFPGVDFETRLSLDCESDHGESVRRRGDGRRPMRRVACRDEANGRESERLAQFAGELQMTAMDRIERTAENAENGIHRRLDCSAGRLRQPGLVGGRLALRDPGNL